MYRLWGKGVCSKPQDRVIFFSQLYHCWKVSIRQMSPRYSSNIPFLVLSVFTVPCEKKKKIHFYFPFSSLVDSVRYFTLHILIFQCCRKVSRCSTFVVQYLLQQLYCCIYVVLFVIRK